MEYQALVNERQHSGISTKRRRNIALALIIVGAFACVGTLLLIKVISPQNEFIVNLAYNEKNKNQLINSTRKMAICSNQFENRAQDSSYVCSIYTTTQNILVTRLSQDVLSVYVVYQSINESKIDLKDLTRKFQTFKEMEEDPNTIFEATKTEVDGAFKATVSTKGILLSLESLNGSQPDILVRLTERLISQTFPEIDPKLYSSPFMLRKNAGRRGRLLGSEESQNLQVQDTYLGEVSAEYTYNIDSEGQTILNKEYNEDDFVTFDYNLGGDLPEIQYTSQTIIDNLGFVASNTESIHFNISDKNPNDQWVELVGSISLKIDSVMEVHSVEVSNEDILSIIQQFEEAKGFQKVDLEADGGLFINDDTSLSQAYQQVGEEIPLLGSSAQFAFTKDVSVFQKSIFSQNVEMKIIQNNYEIYSDIESAVYLNNNKIITLYSLRINHPWLACDNLQNGSESNFDKEYTIFEAQFPIYGIVTIPVRASFRVNLGWRFTMKPNQHMCNLIFSAYARPGIVAEGGISIFNIAEGGISFGGSVINGYFNFGLNVNRQQFSAELEIGAKIIPYSYSIDAYYRYFTCDFVRLFNRNLIFGYIVSAFKSVVKFVVKIVQVCGLSDKKYINISSGQSSQTYIVSLTKQSYLFKNRS